jgi:hypothetical protein
MPSPLHGCCLECGHEWFGLRARIRCGRVEFDKPETYRCYSCTRCHVDLYVPRWLKRASWLRWVAENVSEMTRSPLHFKASELGVRLDQNALDVITRSPLLFNACEKVAAALATTSSRYLPVPIDIGPISCPACADLMIEGDPDTQLAVCPRCEGQSAWSIIEDHPGAMLVDYSPLEHGEARRVILHLEGLAWHPAEEEYSHLELSCLATSGKDLLWDQDLDGRIRG